jgi:hypothetical protein
MKNLITLLTILISLNGYSQKLNYVKSSSDANLNLFNKFKDHLENNGYYGKTLINDEASDILLHKVVWQSRGHFLSHKSDPNHSWMKTWNHSEKLVSTNSDTLWSGMKSAEISTMIPILLRGGDTTNHKDSLQKHINSEKFMEEVFQNFHNSPAHNRSVLDPINSDLKHLLKGQYVNYGIKRYFTIAGGVDLKNRLWEPKYNCHVYYMVVTCVIVVVSTPIENVYPVSYPMGNLGEDYIYTDYSSSTRSRVNKKGKIEIINQRLGEWKIVSDWKRISKKKLSTYLDTHDFSLD